MSLDKIDYYKVLQIDRDAEDEIIEVAYKRLCKKYHPDINKSPDATFRMQEINNAYDTLGNREKRSLYDTQNNHYDDIGPTPNKEQDNPYDSNTPVSHIRMNGFEILIVVIVLIVLLTITSMQIMTVSKRKKANKVTNQTLYYDTGTRKYEGEIINGVPNGKGVYYYKSTGTIAYEGTFVDGKPNGFGTSYDEDGNVIDKGQFKNAKFVEKNSEDESISNQDSTQEVTDSNKTIIDKDKYKSALPPPPHSAFGPKYVGIEDCIRVDLDTACNVFAVDSYNYEKYKRHEDFSYYGGNAKRTPVIICPSLPGTYYVIIDNGGASYSLRAAVNVVSKR